MSSKIYYNRNGKISNPPISPNKKKNKFDIIKIKKETVKSLNEIECFLNNFNKFFNYVKLYKILK